MQRAAKPDPKDTTSPSVVVDTAPLDAMLLFSGDAHFARQLVAQFLRGATTDVQEIENAAATQDWRRAGFVAHRLKGAALNLGASGVGELCKRIQFAGKDGDGAMVQEAAAQLQGTLGATRTAMTSWLAQMEVPDGV